MLLMILDTYLLKVTSPLMCHARNKISDCFKHLGDINMCVIHQFPFQILTSQTFISNTSTVEDLDFVSVSTLACP